MNGPPEFVLGLSALLAPAFSMPAATAACEWQRQSGLYKTSTGCAILVASGVTFIGEGLRGQ